MKTPEYSLNDSLKERQKGKCVVCFGEYWGILDKGKIHLYFLYWIKTWYNETPEISLNDSLKERQKGNCVVCFGEYSGIQNKGKMSVLIFIE